MTGGATGSGGAAGGGGSTGTGSGSGVGKGSATGGAGATGLAWLMGWRAGTAGLALAGGVLAAGGVKRASIGKSSRSLGSDHKLPNELTVRKCSSSEIASAQSSVRLARPMACYRASSGGEIRVMTCRLAPATATAPFAPRVKRPSANQRTA